MFQMVMNGLKKKTNQYLLSACLDGSAKIFYPNSHSGCGGKDCLADSLPPWAILNAKWNEHQEGWIMLDHRQRGISGPSSIDLPEDDVMAAMKSMHG